jgi:sugar O-acyltransferase (sialic acid O-acetyltransferase NeuD family)
VSALLIWGGGGHGRVLADVVRALGYELIGFVDGDPAKLDQVVEPGGARVVMLESEFIPAIRDGRGLPAGCDAIALGLGDNNLRLQCLDLLPEPSLSPLVHPSALVSPSVSIGSGTVVFPGAIINAGARVGRGVIVNTGAVIEHDCEIGDGAHLSPRSTLAGGVRVGVRSWVGAGATVIQRVVVGDDALVAAGATVIRDVPARQRVAGVPAKPIQRKAK